MRYIAPALFLYGTFFLAAPALAQNGDGSREAKTETNVTYRIPRPALFRAEDAARQVHYEDARRGYLSERLQPEQKNHVDPNDARPFRILKQEVDGSPINLFGIIPISTSRHYSHSAGNALLREGWRVVRSVISPVSSSEN